MKYKHYILKRKMENIFIYPFVLLGRCIAALNPLGKEYKIFFFFPFYHTGGAEKVHAFIAQAVGNKDCIIFFTRKSTDTIFYKAFQQSNCTIKNISSYTDNKWLYFFNLIYRGIITGYINKQTLQPIVFNGQSNFGYKISPWIKPTIKQIELIHSFNSFSWIRVPFIPFIHHTIMISKVRIENHLEQYGKLNIPLSFNNKIVYICNGITLPVQPTHKDFTTPLQILYVGRGTEEKRVHIVAEIAEKIHATNPEIVFTLAGDVENAIPYSLKHHCILEGNISDENKLASLYQQSHVLLITSNTEGFPIVVMEAMSYGCAIIATPVGDLPIHVKQKMNGFITTETDSENIVVSEMKNYISELHQNRLLLSEISKKNAQYAKDNFDIEHFKKSYYQLLFS
ncbi:MAG: glycosyltransferase family 4 protein [Chitinophagales bacterium]|nr:glycosyltransferase family 4 protein [Chitinophagales bacterium]